MLLAMVTYTHNDSALLNELLAGTRRWSVQPAHIFVIDDASDPAYALPAELAARFGGSAALSAAGGKKPENATQNEPGHPPPGLDVIRPGKHLGPAQAKSFGIDLAFDAGADVVLSIDCDVRLAKHWLKEALQMLGEPKVGLVGSDFEHGLAGDSLSDYLREFERAAPGILDTQFLGAGVWLTRQDVWRETGGLCEHEQYTHEDLYFSRRLKELGYTLIAHNEPPATQVRRLKASSYFNRQLRYLGFAILGVAKNKGVETALGLIAEQSAARLNRAAELNRPDFAYIELLWISSLLLYLASRGGMGGTVPPGAASNAVSARLREFVQNYPRIRALLQTDLAAMRLVGDNLAVDVPPPHTAGNSGDQAQAAGQIGPLAGRMFGLWAAHPSLLAELEGETGRRLQAENSEFRFSNHYLE